MMKIIFVCSGNTCRSPMAEGLFRLLAQRRGLGDRFLCASAGLSAGEGDPPAENAVLACAELGADISAHRARRLRGREIPLWDLFFTMSETHAYILQQAGVPAEKIYAPVTVPDPYGGDLDTYRRCRDSLAAALEALLDRLEAMP